MTIIVAEKNFQSNVDDRQHSLNPVVRTQAAHYPKNKPDESNSGRPAFTEDFLLEHSRSATEPIR